MPVCSLKELHIQSQEGDGEAHLGQVGSEERW